MKINNHKVKIYKNNAFFDKFQVVLSKDNTNLVYSMSFNPLSPQGLNQFVEQTNNPARTGEKTNFHDVPDNVQKAIIQRIIQ